MIMFVSGATATTVHYKAVGELITPLGWNNPDSLRLAPGMWCMDNGAFSGFDAAAFMKMLQQYYGRKGCRFVTAPDVVADAHATLANWPFWSGVIRGAGFVPAIVLQDGMMVADVPWTEVGAIFIGGSTEWKLGDIAATLMAYGKSRGLWVHVGRVNSAERVRIMFHRGADSFDGTGFSMFPAINIPKGLAWIDHAREQGSLL